MKKNLLILIVATFWSCNFFYKLSFDEELANTINLSFKKEPKAIDLVSVTDFKWDNYLVLGCYQVPDSVGHTLKVDLSNISEYATLNDTKNVLVFIKNKKAIKICEIDRGIMFTKTKLLKTKFKN
jgi:hypothetical protein